jgi:hypothetical protein
MRQGDEMWSSDEESTVDRRNDSERWMHPGIPVVRFVERCLHVFAEVCTEMRKMLYSCSALRIDHVAVEVGDRKSRGGAKTRVGDQRRMGKRR